MATDRLGDVARVWGRGTPAGTWLPALALVFVALALFKLAISGAGWDLDSLTLVQTAIFVALGVLVWAGRVRQVSVSGPLLGVIAAMALATAWSVRPDSSVRELMVWTMYLGIFIVVASTLTGPAAATLFLDAMLAIGGCLCLLALSWSWGAKIFGTRWYATFYWPNPFAAFLLLLLPVTVARFLHARPGRETFAYGVITCVLAVAFVSTYSRGAWLSLALIAPLAGIVLRPPSMAIALRRLAMMTAFVALAVVLLTSRTAARLSPAEGVFERVVSLAAVGDDSIQGRLSFWRSGLGIFRDHSLLGTGPRTYAVVHTRYQDDVRFYASDAHNLYIQTAAEMGLVGAAALALLLISIAALWLRTLRAAQGAAEYPMVVGVGLGLAAFFLHSGLDVDWLFPANPALAFGMVGVLAWYDWWLRVPDSPTTRLTARRWRLPVCVAMLVAVVFVQASRTAYHQFVDGQQLARAGQWSAAAGRFAQATRWNPVNPDYLLAQTVAATHVPVPRFDLAHASLRRAMALDRMNATYPVQLAMLLMIQGLDDPERGTEAEVLLRQALVLDRFNDPEVYRVLAHLYLRQGRIEEAQRVYRDARRLYLGHGLGRGSVIYLQTWQKVVNLVLDGADLSTRRGNLSEAAQVLQELLSEDPSVVRAAVRLGAIYMTMGRQDDARKVLEAAAARAPNDAEIRAALKALR